jgi:4-diphosphocytidyl-2-C-methyl-D-erythritol kinase
VKVEAYAKINLTLEVFGRRDDGYHRLRSVVQQISLSDTLRLADAAVFSCDSGYDDDLALKAARMLAEKTGVRRAVSISIEKRIPAGGGLGGGSADAAAALLALNEMWRLGLSIRELASLGAEVGSDVPALVYGGTVVMEGRGEAVTPFAADEVDCRPLNLVLVNPGVFSGTAEVFSHYKPRLQDDPSILYNMRSALNCGDYRSVAAAVMNDLRRPAVELHPEIAEALDSLEKAGAEGVSMSGSGSTVFGLVSDEASGREIASLMNDKGYWAECVHTIVR